MCGAYMWGWIMRNNPLVQFSFLDSLGWRSPSCLESACVSRSSLTHMPVPAVLTYRQTAVYLGLSSVDALRMMVMRKKAPPSISYGIRDRRFRVADIDGWLAAKAAASVRREETSEHVEAPKRKRGRPTKAEVIARRGASQQIPHRRE